MSLEYGILAHPRSESSILQLENDGFNGEAKIDFIDTTWPDSQDGTADPFGGPWWNGESGSGSTLDKKFNDMQNTFDGTGRRLCTMYQLTDPDVQDGNTTHNYRPGVNGDMDADWKQFANTLINHGMEDTIIRPNSEHTRPWSRRFPEDENGNPAPDEYADAFARCVSVMQGYRSVNGSTVSGANFTFIYNPAGYFDGSITAQAWPVDSPFWPSGEDVPIVTPSFKDSETWDSAPTFDEWENMTNAEQEAAADKTWQNDQKPWLDDYQTWANSVNASMGTVEWGTKHPIDPSDADGDTALGDNPYYVNHCWDYFEANDWELAGWWNATHFEGSHSFIYTEDDGIDSDLPRSFEAFKNQVVGATTAPDPEPDARFFVREGGNSVVPSAVYYNDNGTEREASAVYVNDNGVEREVWPDAY